MWFLLSPACNLLLTVNVQRFFRCPALLIALHQYIRCLYLSVSGSSAYIMINPSSFLFAKAVVSFTPIFLYSNLSHKFSTVSKYSTYSLLYGGLISNIPCSSCSLKLNLLWCWLKYSTDLTTDCALVFEYKSIVICTPNLFTISAGVLKFWSSSWLSTSNNYLSLAGTLTTEVIT